MREIHIGSVQVMLVWAGRRSSYGWGLEKWRWGHQSSWRHGVLYAHILKVVW